MYPFEGRAYPYENSEYMGGPWWEDEGQPSFPPQALRIGGQSSQHVGQSPVGKLKRKTPAPSPKIQPSETTLGPNSIQASGTTALTNSKGGTTTAAKVGDKKQCLSLQKNVVGVNSVGMVDASCVGKNKWHAEWRAVLLRWLDLSKAEFDDQDVHDWEGAVVDMNSKWEYRGAVPAKVEESLKKHARTILKSERHRLKSSWITNGSNADEPSPEWMNSDTWQRLLALFTSEEGKAKSAQMSYARNKVKKVSCLGRGGQAQADVDKVSLQFLLCLVGGCPSSLSMLLVYCVTMLMHTVRLSG